jgi:dihydrofolate synthase / folylpolyglutamate synthase
MASAPELNHIHLGLDRIQAVLARLGNPERKLPPIIHIAGTNGKGSTAAYLTAIFQAAGYRVHRYTSPHLVRRNERILLANEEISDAEFDACLNESATPALRTSSESFQDVSENIAFREPQINNVCSTPSKDYELVLTPFEHEAAAMFLAMSRTPAGIAIIEVGLGGRLDATNVVQPALTIITPISMDHMDFLGNTIEKIAFEKAGIIKTGVPCVVGKQTPSVLRVIEETGALKGATIHAPRTHPNLSPALAGAHQMDNANTAATAAHLLQSQFPRLTQHAIEEGIRTAKWPARLQQLRENLWLDGGHNAQGGEVLAAFLKDKPNVHLICGMMADKDTRGYLAHLAPIAKHLTAIAVPNEPRSQTAAEIARIAHELGIPATTAESVEVALDAAPKNATIVICGSLYLAGYVFGSMQP